MRENWEKIKFSAGLKKYCAPGKNELTLSISTRVNQKEKKSSTS